MLAQITRLAREEASADIPCASDQARRKARSSSGIGIVIVDMVENWQPLPETQSGRPAGWRTTAIVPGFSIRRRQTRIRRSLYLRREAFAETMAAVVSRKRAFSFLLYKTRIRILYPALAWRPAIWPRPEANSVLSPKRYSAKMETQSSEAGFGRFGKTPKVRCWRFRSDLGGSGSAK